MKAKMIGMAMLAMLMATAPCMARKNNGKQDKRGYRIEMRGDSTGCRQGKCIFDGLGLNADQKARLQQSNEKYRAEKQTLYNDSRKYRRECTDSLRQATRKQAMEIKRQHLQEIRAILTADQYIEFLEQSYLTNPGPGKPKINAKAQRERQDRPMKRQTIPMDDGPVMSR